MATVATAAVVAASGVASAAPAAGVHEGRRGNTVVSATIDRFGALITVRDLIVSCGSVDGVARRASGELRAGGQRLAIGGAPTQVAADDLTAVVPAACLGLPTGPGDPRAGSVSLVATGRVTRLSLPARATFRYAPPLGSPTGLRGVIATIDGRRRTASVSAIRICEPPPGGVVRRTLVIRTAVGVPANGLIRGGARTSLSGLAGSAGNGAVRMRPIVRSGKVQGFSAALRMPGCPGDPLTAPVFTVRLTRLAP